MAVRSSVSIGPVDAALRERANRVIPNGGYGHMASGGLPAGYPQFIGRAEGARLWDVDGREYLDLMCSWGPIILGHRHPAVEEAVAEQNQRGDCLNGYSPKMVELAERITDVISHADWAMFAKNGTDATTMCCVIARAHTQRDLIVVARGAYHGAAPWCTPNPQGIAAADRANILYFDYNDLESLEDAIGGKEGQIAAVLVCPHRHDTRRPQELADPDFARGVRALCDRIGAVMVMDEVRTGFRVDLRGSWEAFGVRPNLSAWSKAIANGWPLAAVLGEDSLRGAAGSIFSTGSFWFSGNSMAASVATIDVLTTTPFLAQLERSGKLLREGLAAQAAHEGFHVEVSGPMSMPLLTFADDDDFERGNEFATLALRHGVFLHPTHNWFLSAAHSDQVVAEILDRTSAAFSDLAQTATVGRTQSAETGS